MWVSVRQLIMASLKSSRACTSSSLDPIALSASERYTNDWLRARPGAKSAVPFACRRLPCKKRVEGTHKHNGDHCDLCRSEWEPQAPPPPSPPRALLLYYFLVQDT